MSSVEQREPFVIDFQAAFDRFIATKAKVWAHNRSTTLGASEAFNCLRQLVCEKRGGEFGVTVDEDYEERWGATHRGNMVEEFFVAPALQQELPAIGLTLEFAGDQQQTIVDGRNSSTPDGLIFDIPVGPVRIKAGGKVIDLPWVEAAPGYTTGTIGLEIKSIDPRAILEEERAKHFGQCQIGMGIVREKTEHRPQYWVILYLDASFLDNIVPFVVEYNPEVYAAAKQRATQVWSFASVAEAPAEGKFDGGCDYCKFKHACGEAIVSKWKETSEHYTPMDIEAAFPEVARLVVLRDQFNQAEHDLNEGKQAFKDWLSNRRLQRMNEDTFTFAWRTQKGKVNKSTAKMADKITELAARLTALGEETVIDFTEFESTGAAFDVLTFDLKDPDRPTAPKKTRKPKEKKS